MPEAATTNETEARLKELFGALWNDGELGAKVRAKAKEKFPDITLPEESFSPILEPLKKSNETLRAEIEAMRKEREEEKAAAAERARQTTFEEGVKKAVSTYALSEDGAKKMVERMFETKNYTDPDAAAAWVAAQTTPAAAPGPSWAIGDKKANFFGEADYDEKFKKLHNDPQGYMVDELTQFSRDPDAYVRETFGNAA
jgi:hypothetical protein